MNSIIDRFLSSPFSWLWERRKLARDGHIELSTKRPYAEGSYLYKPAGRSLMVSVTSLSIRQPIEYTASDLPEYSYISLSPGPMRSIAGASIEKDKVYRHHYPAGFTYCEAVGVLFLPKFFDTFLNSRHGISPDEIAQAIEVLGKFPMISDAAMILKQIGKASFTGDVGNIWIEAKALELVSVVLDWYRRLAAVAPPRSRNMTGRESPKRYAMRKSIFPSPLPLRYWQNKLP
jgi:hypothetical protein